jgi:TolB-like protein/DNA-binding winged helix-turn-helix (wHTH) protein
VYEFDEFHLDPKKRVLRLRHAPVPLTPKAFEMLLVLVKSEGLVMTKDELIKAVWADSFVEDSNLTQIVFVLRKALGETPDRRYILTVQGQGYRFAADVKLVSGNEIPTELVHLPGAGVSAATESSEPKEKTETLSRHSWDRRLWLIIAGTLGALLIAISTGYLRWSSTGTKAQPPNARIMLAVLPFQNLTGDAGQEYFSDGMTEELISQMGNLDPQHLGIIARTSVMHYKNGQPPLDQIGRELGVQFVLEGSVRRDADKVRITAQLIQMKDQSHLWAHNYDRELGDVLLLQSDMAGAIAQEILAKISANAQPLVAQVSRVDPEEQDLYLRGRYHLGKGSEDEINIGIEYFRQAIEHSPRDARNYAALADSYLALSDYYLSPAATLELGKQAAVKALQLDDNLAETHVSLGAIRFLYDWDWPQAEKEFTQAVKLNPNSSDAHLWRGVFLAQMGRSDEGISEIKVAESLDPLSLAVHVNAGWVYYLARRDEQAVQEWRKILDIDPHFTVTHASIWIAYVKQAEMGTVLSPPSSGDADALQLAAITGRQAVTGNRGEAERLLSRLDSISKRHYVCPYEMATAHAILGNKDKALDWLSRGLKERSACMADLKVDPRLDSLRSDARFEDFLRRVGFQK